MGVLALVALLAVAGCVGGVSPADGGGTAGAADAGEPAAADGGPAAADSGPAAADSGPAASDSPMAQATPTNGSAGTTTVQVAATGTVEADPDQAVVRVAVTATAPNATAVRDRLAANVSSMRAALADAGVPDDRIRTVSFDIRQEPPDPEEPGPVRFRGVHAFEITVSNVSRVGTVLDAAVTGGANQVDQVAFTLSEATRREARADALREAVNDARADAETVTDAAGLALVGVRAISTGEADVGPVRLEAAEATADGTEVSPGPVTVTARVQVTYNATASEE